FHSQRARGVGHALRMISAGVGDHSTLALFIAQRSNLVVGAAQFESTDGLQVLWLEIKLAVVPMRQLKLDKPGSRSNSQEARLRFTNIRQCNDGIASVVA